MFAAAALVSYERAKAESLGFDARGGLMERAERFILLGFGLLFSELLIGVLWVMLVATSGTAVYRFVKVWRQADRPQKPPRPTTRTRTRRRTGSTRSMADRRAGVAASACAAAARPALNRTVAAFQAAAAVSRGLPGAGRRTSSVAVARSGASGVLRRPAAA